MSDLKSSPSQARSLEEPIHSLMPHSAMVSAICLADLSSVSHLFPGSHNVFPVSRRKAFNLSNKGNRKSLSKTQSWPELCFKQQIKMKSTHLLAFTHFASGVWQCKIAFGEFLSMRLFPKS